jgi:hypothetical protein
MTPELCTIDYLNKPNLVYFKRYLLLQNKHCSRIQELGGSWQNETINIEETTRCLKFRTLGSLWIYRNVPFSWRCGVIVVGNRSVFYFFSLRPRKVSCHTIDTTVLCSFVSRFQHLARASCLQLLLYKKWTLNMEGADSSQVFVAIYQTSRCIMPQEHRVWVVAVWWG